MTKPTEDKAPIFARISAELREALQEHAQLTGMKQEAIIEQAIRRYIYSS